MICMIESGKITILLSLYRLITLNIAVSLIKICSTDLVFIQNIIHSYCHKGCYLIIFSRLSIMQVILNFLRVFKNMYENQAHTEHLNVSYNSLDYMKFVQIFSLRDNGKNIFRKIKKCTHQDQVNMKLTLIIYQVIKSVNIFSFYLLPLLIF